MIYIHCPCLNWLPWHFTIFVIERERKREGERVTVVRSLYFILPSEFIVNWKSVLSCCSRHECQICSSGQVLLMFFKLQHFIISFDLSKGSLVKRLFPWFVETDWFDCMEHSRFRLVTPTLIPFSANPLHSMHKMIKLWWMQNTLGISETCRKKARRDEDRCLDNGLGLILQQQKELCCL